VATVVEHDLQWLTAEQAGTTAMVEAIKQMTRIMEIFI
jgi:hypothetical protein